MKLSLLWNLCKKIFAFVVGVVLAEVCVFAKRSFLRESSK